MKDTIFYVGGGKGGVGKSIVSLTLVDYLITKYSETKTVHLIETDESNPDVGRVYKGKIPVTTAILEENEKLLPANPKVNSFRQACRRELIRQKKENGRTALPNDAPKQVAKKLGIDSGKPVTTAKAGVEDQKALEMERRKKLGLDKGINTPSGMIIKDAEGGFEF